MTEDLTPSEDARDGADEFDRLLVRYFSGRPTGDDERRLDRWLAGGVERPRELERLRHLWLRSAVEPMDVPVEEALARFKERARRDEIATRSAPTFQPTARTGMRPRRSWLAAAAAILVAAGAGVWWRWAVSTGHTWRGSTAAVAPHGAPSRLYATARGQRATMRLPDGSEVMLAPGSMLELPAGFGNGARDVRLTGLAFFSVAKDSTRPFRVHGGGGIAQVLGTKFAVRAGTGSEAAIEVVVAEGRVALRPSGTPDHAAREVLTHGDLGRITADGNVATVRGVDLAKRLGWIEGRLSFDRTPLPVVLQELSTWFDVDFIIASPKLRDAELTTQFDNDSLADMLRVLGAALGAETEVTGKTVTLKVVGRS